MNRIRAAIWLLQQWGVRLSSVGKWIIRHDSPTVAMNAFHTESVFRQQMGIL